MATPKPRTRRPGKKPSTTPRSSSSKGLGKAKAPGQLKKAAGLQSARSFTPAGAKTATKAADTTRKGIATKVGTAKPAYLGIAERKPGASPSGSFGAGRDVVRARGTSASGGFAKGVVSSVPGTTAGATPKTQPSYLGIAQRRR